MYDIVSVRNVEKISELNSLVRKSINFDFPESSINDKAEMSQEDKKFLDKKVIIILVYLLSAPMCRCPTIMCKL